VKREESIESNFSNQSRKRGSPRMLQIVNGEKAVPVKNLKKTLCRIGGGNNNTIGIGARGNAKMQKRIEGKMEGVTYSEGQA